MNSQLKKQVRDDCMVTGIDELTSVAYHILCSEFLVLHNPSSVEYDKPAIAMNL